MEKHPEEKSVEFEIDLNQRFTFPNDIVIKKFENKNIVIYTKGVLWLVFSDEELEVFNALNLGKTISQVLEKYTTDIVISVLSQIKAKRFEKPIINESYKRNMYIYLTNNCNERCRHCYMYAGDVKVQELPIEVWKQVLLDYKENGGNGITFTGGEVTVYREFKHLLEYSYELGLKNTVLTNGILWQDEDIKKYSHFIDEVQISVDGYDRDSYFKVRQFDGFEKAISTLIKFNNTGIRTAMAVTPLYENIEAFVKNFELFAKKFIAKYPNIYIRINLELLDGREVSKTNIDNSYYRDILYKLVERLYPDYYINSFPLNYENHTIRRNCGFGEIALSANGDVYWCNRIHELSTKLNVNTTKFSDILNISKQIRISTDVDHLSECQKCEIRYICGGDCRMNFMGIKQADGHKGVWNVKCPAGKKESFYRKMIQSNELFYVDYDEVQ